MDLSNQRRQYEAQPLLESDAPTEPWGLFETWLKQALEEVELDPTAMTLATADRSARPSARIVLLKGWSRRGLAFYSRYSTRKGQELDENPQAALLLHWKPLHRQVRIEGRVQRLERQESQRYFESRPLESRLAARAASELDGPILRQQLHQRFAEERSRWADSAAPPLPEDWGGYLLRPLRWEFWQGQPDRLHDRLVYCAATGEPGAETAPWSRHRLAP